MSDHEQDRNTDMQDEQQWLRALLLRDSERFQLPDSLKSENLLHKLEVLDTPDNEDVKVLEIKPQKRGKTLYFKYLSYAACIAIVLFGWYNAQQTNTMSTAPEAATLKAAQPQSAEASAGASMVAADIMSAQAEPEVAQPVAESYAQVYNALTTVWSNQTARYGYGGVNDNTGGRVMLQGEVMAEMPSADMAPKPSTGGGSGVYSTNVQIEGVDEADIVKTDGVYIYQYRFDSATGGAQIAISTVNGLKLLSTILLPEYADAQLYLTGNRLVVVQSVPEKEAETLLAPLDQTLSDYVGNRACRNITASAQAAAPTGLL